MICVPPCVGIDADDGGCVMADCDSTHAFGMVATVLRRTAYPSACRALLAVVPFLLAVSLLGPGSARGGTITATSAEDYATAISSANITAPATQIVINSPSGTAISLGGTALPTLFAGSTLQIGNGSVDSPISGGTINDNGALNFNPPNAANDTIDTIIAGSGMLMQQGLGMITLTGSNTYSGGTTIASGSTLILGDGISYGIVGSGAVSNNGTLAFNEPDSSSSNFTFANNIGGTGTVAFQTPFLSLIILTGTNTYSGGTTITGNFGFLGAVELTSPSALPTTGTILLLQSGGLATGYALDQTTLNAINGNSQGFVALQADSANPLDFTNLPNVSLGATTTNYLNALPPWTYSGTFTPTPPGNGSLSNTNYQYQVGGGNGFLAISSNLSNPPGSVAELDAINDGFTILQGTNTFTGGLNVTFGVVELAGSQAYCGGAFGDCPKIQVSQSGILATGYALDQTTLNAIAAASNGTVALGANSSNNLDFTNLPTVSLGAVGSYTYSGTITPGANGYLLGGGGDVRIGPGDIFGDPGSYLTVSSDLPGNFGLTVNSTGFDLGTVILVNAKTYTGQTVIDGGTLQLGNGSLNGSIANSTGVTINNAGPNPGNLVFNEAVPITIANPIGGAGDLVQIGPGTVTLTRNETYTGTTTIYRGSLALGSGASIAASSTVGLADNYLGSTAGVLDISQGGSQTVQNLNSFWFLNSGNAMASVVLGSNTLTDNANSGTTAFDGVISGAGAFVKQGAETLILAGDNTYSGGTTISAGTLVLGGLGVFAPTATVGTVGSGPVLDNAALVFQEPSAVTLLNTISGNGTVTQNGPGTVTLTGTNTYSGGTTIAAGTTLGLGGQAPGEPAATVGTPGTGGVADSGTLEFTEPSPATFTNLISGTGGVTQAGPGAITLDAANTYTGLTTVAAGSLSVGSSAGNGASVGGSVLVDAGATLAGYGSLGVATSGTTLTNNGTVIPGGASGNAVGTLFTAGNYVQGSGGNLLIAVTPAQASQLQVGGTATLAGTITFAYAPGSYVPTTYTVLAANGAISGRFGTVAEQGAVPTKLTRTVEYIASTPDPVLLVLGKATVVPPTGDSIFSEQLSSLTALSDAAAATLLDGGASANDCPMGGVPPTPSESGAASRASSGMTALARMICGKGGWIHADGTFLGVDGSGGYPNYHASTAGFLAGIDGPVGDGGLRLGIAAGYDHRWLTDSAGASATADVARFGVYAIQPIGPVVLNAAFLYGHDWDTTNRPTGIGIATAQYGGNEFSGGVRASLPISLSGFTAVPMAGVRFASVGGDSFTETGSGALSGFGVSGAAATQLSVLPYARFVLSRDCITASGITVSPYATIGYQYQAGNTEQPVLLTAADGTVFNAGSAGLDRSAATLGVGVAAGHGNWSVFAAYGALVSGNWQEQEINVGLRVSF
jgi:fibronectin-binding autotransporter adhesin